MNEDSSAAAQEECGGQIGVELKRGGNVSAKCYKKGDTAVKCNLPAECKYGFKIEPDPGNPVGRLICLGPPTANTTVVNNGSAGDVAGRDVNKTLITTSPPIAILRLSTTEDLSQKVCADPYQSPRCHNVKDGDSEHDGTMKCPGLMNVTIRAKDDGGKLSEPLLVDKIADTTPKWELEKNTGWSNSSWEWNGAEDTKRLRISNSEGGRKWDISRNFGSYSITLRVCATEIVPTSRTRNAGQWSLDKAKDINFTVPNGSDGTVLIKHPETGTEIELQLGNSDGNLEFVNKTSKESDTVYHYLVIHEQR